MKKVLIGILCFCFILCTPATLCGCKVSINQTRDQKVMINDINYSSLSEAVQNAKDGDKIEIYNDISDNKNIIIDKSVSIIGKTQQSNIKPKFYGSITIDANKSDDNVSIENIEIITPGKYNEDSVNNTLYAINLIDGGLSIKNCKIMPYESGYDENTCGIVVSRKIDSINNMPIVISGNEFGCFEHSDQLNAAVLIKNNKSGQFKNLNINTQNIQSKNSFDNNNNKECNQIVQIDYSSAPEKYPFVSTSSAAFLIDCLQNNHQTSNFNTYTLTNAEHFQLDDDQPINILTSTSLTFDGTKSLDLQNTRFKVAGTVLVNTEIQNAIFERTTDTATILFGENIDKSKIIII